MLPSAHQKSLNSQTSTSRPITIEASLHPVPKSNAISAACRAGTIVLRLEGDVVLYALGTGEYDELNCECMLQISFTL